MVDGQL